MNIAIIFLALSITFGYASSEIFNGNQMRYRWTRLRRDVHNVGDKLHKDQPMNMQPHETVPQQQPGLQQNVGGQPQNIGRQPQNVGGLPQRAMIPSGNIPNSVQTGPQGWSGAQPDNRLADVLKPWNVNPGWNGGANPVNPNIQPYQVQQAPINDRNYQNYNPSPSNWQPSGNNWADNPSNNNNNPNVQPQWQPNSWNVPNGNSNNNYYGQPSWYGWVGPTNNAPMTRPQWPTNNWQNSNGYPMGPQWPSVPNHPSGNDRTQPWQQNPWNNQQPSWQQPNNNNNNWNNPNPNLRPSMPDWNQNIPNGPNNNPNFNRPNIPNMRNPDQTLMCPCLQNQQQPQQPNPMQPGSNNEHPQQPAAIPNRQDNSQNNPNAPNHS